MQIMHGKVTFFHGLLVGTHRDNSKYSFETFEKREETAIL